MSEAGNNHKFNLAEFHDLLGALAERTHLPGNAMKVLLIVLQKTLLWGKLEEKFSASYLALKTGLCRVSAQDGKKVLLDRNIITCRDLGTGIISFLAVNKDFTTWRTCRDLGTPAANLSGFRDRGCRDLGTPNLSLKGDTLKKGPKELILKKRTVASPQNFPPDSEPHRLAALLLALIQQRRSTFTPKPHIQAWAAKFDQMLRLDKGRTAKEAAALIRWCQADPFWQNNILSPGKFREKFDQLALKMAARRPSREPSDFSDVKEGFSDPIEQAEFERELAEGVYDD